MIARPGATRIIARFRETRIIPFPRDGAPGRGGRHIRGLVKATKSPPAIEPNTRRSYPATTIGTSGTGAREANDFD